MQGFLKFIRIVCIVLLCILVLLSVCVLPSFIEFPTESTEPPESTPAGPPEEGSSTPKETDPPPKEYITVDGEVLKSCPKNTATKCRIKLSETRLTAESSTP